MEELAPIWERPHPLTPSPVALPPTERGGTPSRRPPRLEEAGTYLLLSGALLSGPPLRVLEDIDPPLVVKLLERILLPPNGFKALA